ncbi:ATP-grasp domain-containing protein [Xenorhabdus sp. DI]|uniref:ATP-grasp domain-containing protein n=1 Tax=Xenorhabdus doucetiae TaxID=351671 RepID=UPI0019B836F1|nr:MULTISPECIES: ATP-grasp domain-containing protein [unclassified Xenorhabdus]MBD2786225.1 ATP-grasp domain-containing protein [Xenorhabdus sp. 3]MBD2789883.1 ATP-grasp domain-containing protein [Xenorhabdus sp. DI]
MSNGYILILGGEFSLRERVLAGALRASEGKRVITMAKSRINPNIKFFDGYLSGDVANAQEVLNSVIKYEKETGEKPVAVIPMNDFTVSASALLTEHYKLYGNDTGVIKQCKNKYLMKKILKESGLPVPKFAEFKTLDELKKHIANIGLPVVIKPNEMAGSLGVIKITYEEDIESAFSQCVNDVISLNGEAHAPEDLFIVEEYINTIQEVSVEVINQGSYHEVLAVTDKYLGDEPHFVEIGHSMPSIHSDNHELRDVAVRACEALGIKFGIAHFEARITSEGHIKIIEVGARTGGDTIMDLIERTYGINPYELHVSSHLNKLSIDSFIINPKGLSAVAFIKAKEGTIERVILPSSLPDYITNMQVTAKPLDISQSLVSWKTREGSIEFFWKNKRPEIGFKEHIDIAKQYSESLFTFKQ